MTKIKELENINPFYRGTDFWMLNGELSEDEIIFQLTKMKKQGVYSFIARTYIGLESDYPGEDFKSKMKIIIETAKKLDMKLFLQAGYMPEYVPGLSEKDTLKCIEVSKERCDDALCEKDGFYFRKISCTSFLDMFSPDTVKRYLKASYEEIWEEFSDEFGKTIMSIWVDEPSYSRQFLPYPNGIEERFFERWGYPLCENIPKLYIDIEGYESVRYHYRKLLQDMLEESYFKNLHFWCAEHNLMASGHLMEEDSLNQQIGRAGAIMPYYPYFDMPGIDILCGELNFRDNPILPGGGRGYSYKPQYMLTPLQCTSVSRQMGTMHTLCEMYGVTSQDMTFRNQKYLFDYMAAHGINHRSVHGMFYSLSGRRKRAYPPHINYYQPYFDDYKKMTDYIMNVSKFVSLGKTEGDVLLIHPLPSAFCEYSPFDTPSSEELNKRDKSLLKLVTNLTLSGVEFDLGDERIIEQYGSVSGSTFTIGEMNYKTVILPSLKTISKTTYELILSFINGGGKVLILDSAPYMIDGILCSKNLFPENAVTYTKSDNLTKILDFIGDKAFKILHAGTPSVMLSRRCDKDKAYYFVFNTDCSECKKVTLRIKEQISASSVDGFSGEICKIPVKYGDGFSDIPLSVPEGGSIMLITENKSEKVQSTHKKESTIYTFDESWNIKRHNENVLLLDFCRYKKSDGEYSEEIPTIAVDIILKEENFSGTLYQKYIFESDVEIPLTLAIEKAMEHTITLNGTEVKSDVCGYYMSKDFEKISLHVCKKGENELILKRAYSPLETPKSVIGSLFTSLKGCETENIYLLGDFKVLTACEAERKGNIRLCKNMILAEENKKCCGELTTAGYPFYAGSITLSSDFITDDTENLFLYLNSFTGCIAEVFVNGIFCGNIIAPPYKVDISSAVRSGCNTLEITMKNTLRNLLGPYHRVNGEIGDLFGNGYSGLGAAWRGESCKGDKWYYGREYDSEVWTDSYMCTSFGISDVKIIKETEK